MNVSRETMVTNSDIENMIFDEFINQLEILGQQFDSLYYCRNNLRKIKMTSIFMCFIASKLNERGLY